MPIPGIAAPLAALLQRLPVVPGSWGQSSPGIYTFVVPEFNSIRLILSGSSGGGGGGISVAGMLASTRGGDGGDGASTHIDGLALEATGGLGGSGAGGDASPGEGGGGVSGGSGGGGGGD
jgi:hypothetical protein